MFDKGDTIRCYIGYTSSYEIGLVTEKLDESYFLFRDIKNKFSNAACLTRYPGLKGLNNVIDTMNLSRVILVEKNYKWN